jgi:hypothetical protein
MRLSRLVTAFVTLLVSIAMARAETVGHFDIGDCNDDGCEILTPDTGEAMDWRLTKKELTVANKAYDTLAAIDQGLEARGFVDIARVAFAYSVHGGLTPDGWIGTVVVDVYLRRVHGNSFDQINEAMWSTGPYAWWPIADTGAQEFHPTTGAKLSVSSAKSRAKSLPDCFKNGDPARDCQPIRYNKWVGCLLSEDDQLAFANDVSAWRTWDQADLAILPDAEPQSQVDLSTAEVKPQAAKTPEKPKKTADNPAGRELCGFSHTY